MFGWPLWIHLPDGWMANSINTIEHLALDAVNAIHSLIICVKLLLCQCQKLRVNFMSESDDWTLST